MIGPAHYDEIQALCDLDMREDETFLAHYAVQERNSHDVKSQCSAGNCVEIHDAQGNYKGGWGPVGCPCGR